MIIDSRNEFCDAIALNTGGAGTYLIGSQIDTSAADNMGAQNDGLYLVITVDTAFASSNSTATAQFTLASDDSASVSTTTASKHIVTKAFTVAEAVAGAVLYVGRLPFSGVEAYERYLGILQTTGTEAFTAGKINAFLTPDASTWSAKADAI